MYKRIHVYSTLWWTRERDSVRDIISLHIIYTQRRGTREKANERERKRERQRETLIGKDYVCIHTHRYAYTYTYTYTYMYIHTYTRIHIHQ